MKDVRVKNVYCELIFRFSIDYHLILVILSYYFHSQM